LRPLPWSPATGHVLGDLSDEDGAPITTAPRSVLSRVIERLQALGYHAQVGIELEFYLLDADRQPLGAFQQCYSTQAMNRMDPLFGDLLVGLDGFVDVEAANAEYGPGQCEINLRHKPALEAADQAIRFRYAVKELARRAGSHASFMAKPFNGFSGSSMHAHVSLWRDQSPAFAGAGHQENTVMRRALGGVVGHLPGIALYSAPTVNAYRRFESGSFAPTTATWGGDNRTASVRSLVDTPDATRLELRVGGADAHPHWATAALLAAIVAGIERELEPGPRGSGDLYQAGAPLPLSLGEAIDTARADAVITEILGEEAVSDYTLLADAEWRAFLTTVTAWDSDRYGEAF
jgi:glutamine synthetase